MKGTTHAISTVVLHTVLDLRSQNPHSHQRWYHFVVWIREIPLAPDGEEFNAFAEDAGNLAERRTSCHNRVRLDHAC